MKVKSFNVIPKLPPSLRPLRDIAMNTWFTWNWPAAQLFLRLDPQAWERHRQNLAAMLGSLSQQFLDEASRDDSIVANLNRVYSSLQEYLASKTWFHETHSEVNDLRIAYFSMEFGLGVGLPIYSGGLGILAGDHLKSSSDLGLPLVGVGLLYQQGYFEQYLNSDGWQGERYPVNDWYNMPVTLLKDDQHRDLTVTVDLAGEPLVARIWRVSVGRTYLYLLDTNVTENPPHLRQITAQLYGGDRENRLRQEILLGVGGIRALEKVGFKPTVYHMNEGHSAFLALERLRQMIQRQNLTFAQAREAVWASNVFTTHTPVPAGNEMFDLGLVRKYFYTTANELGLTYEQFQELGQEEPGRSSNFSMTVLALKLAAHCNGVSELHGQVSRKMWRNIWPGLPDFEIPIGHVTNGVHIRSWISHDMEELFVRYIGPQFLDENWSKKHWERIDAIPDGELWRIHQIRKERLIFFARKRMREQLKNRGAGSSELKAAEEVLSSNALTIGFARRFAGYKRADLMLSDIDRLKKILDGTERPVQIIMAGKAHPADNPGKEMIRKLIHFASDPSVRDKFVFIENYDINVAQYMVQGVDIWLNNPRRPLEASGTSGMKAAANGALNVSTLDGWWAEAYTPEVGWAIGSGETYLHTEEQDIVESHALYHLFEHEVIPLYYDRDRTEMPRRWIKLMKNSMKTLGAQFNTGRMVQEYTENLYLRAHKFGQQLNKDNFEHAKEVAEWRVKIGRQWNAVSLTSEELDPDHEVQSGEEFPVRAKVNLGDISPDDVAVEVLYGVICGDQSMCEGKPVRLKYTGSSDGRATFEGSLPTRATGRHGYAVRIRPENPNLVHPLTPLLMTWE